jgi:hypothetical protein
MTDVDNFMFDMYRKEIYQIIYRVSVGLDDMTDITMGSAFLYLFLNSSDSNIQVEGIEFLAKLPILEKFFPEYKQKISMIPLRTNHSNVELEESFFKSINLQENKII